RTDALEDSHAVLCAYLGYLDMLFQVAVDAGQSEDLGLEERAMADGTPYTGEKAITDFATDRGTLAGAALVQKEKEINAFLVKFLGVSEQSREDLMWQMSREDLTQQVSTEDTMQQVSREYMMRQIRKEAQPVTEILETLKKELKTEIKKRPAGLWHVTDQKNLKIIQASEKRMTMYQNDYLSAVFASSDERQKLLYAARAAGSGMTVDDKRGICRFDTEPFADHAGDIYTLKKTVYAYELDPESFEPVIDFLLKKDGHARIFYGSEWICRCGNAPVRGCQEITQIDRRKLGENMQIR
ncbi:MAG: hypothetical protein LUD01_07255, partial [Clostridiales bacterium]|nr:hypothetical protein [Clostridiales bacterium]